MEALTIQKEAHSPSTPSLDPHSSSAFTKLRELPHEIS